MSNKAEKIAFLQQSIATLVEDAQKTDKGVKAAGVRVRKGLLDIMKAAKEIRTEILTEAKTTEASAEAKASGKASTLKPVPAKKNGK